MLFFSTFLHNLPENNNINDIYRYEEKYDYINRTAIN